MAQYEENSTDVVQTFADSGLNAKTIDAIGALLSDPTTQIEEYDGGPVAEGTDLLTVGAGQTLTEDPGAPVIIMDADAPGADLVLDTSGGDRLLVAGGGDDNIVSQGDGNVSVETGGGNDSISTGGGDDQVVITGDGDSTVSTGDGGDEIVITGAGSASVDTGTGNDTITLASDSGEATVDGGEGFDGAQLDDIRDNHNFTLVDGILTLNSAPTQLENVEVVKFQDGISVLAENSTNAAVTRLYEVMFDREADLDGLEYWINTANAGSSLGDIASYFASSQEYQDEFASDSNEVFLGKLYQGMAGREADAEGLAYWLGHMEDNGLSQAEVAKYFAESQEAVQLMGIDGTQYVIDLDGQE
jgi:Ca2+-binding RTX toxin-like protein